MRIKKWEKLGEGEIKVTYPYDVVYNFNNHTLLISEEGISEIDVKNNYLITYPEANLGIIKSLNKNNTLASVAYNESQGAFMLLLIILYQFLKCYLLRKRTCLENKNI